MLTNIEESRDFDMVRLMKPSNEDISISILQSNTRRRC